MNPPTPDAVRSARLAANLTQAEAAGLVYATPRAWANWEAGTRQMDQALFHLFIQRLTTTDDGTMQSVLGTFPAQHNRESAGLVVALLNVNGMQQPIDVIASDRFLAFEPDGDGVHAVISSLAVERGTSKPYVHRTRLVLAHNRHVEDAARRWLDARQ